MDMKKILNRVMADNGEVHKEKDIKIFGKPRKSRGYYIVMGSDSTVYLHKDGVPRESVKQPDGTYAFWATEKSASEFLENWKAEILGS